MLLSCSPAVVPSDSATLFRTAAERVSCGVHKWLRTDGVPTSSLTLLFWRWLTVSSVFTSRSAGMSYSQVPAATAPPPPPTSPPLRPVPNKPYVASVDLQQHGRKKKFVHRLHDTRIEELTPRIAAKTPLTACSLVEITQRHKRPARGDRHGGHVQHGRSLESVFIFPPIPGVGRDPPRPPPPPPPHHPPPPPAPT